MLCLAADASFNVTVYGMFHLAVYITIQSGSGPVKNGKCDDSIAMSSDN